MKKFLTLTLTLTLTLALAPLSAVADETEEALNPIEAECVNDLPNAADPKKNEFLKTEEAWKNVKNKNSRTYQAKFEDSQKAYHRYVQCLFDTARAFVLDLSKKRQGTFTVYTPNIPWINPKAACLSIDKKPDKLDSMIRDTQPDYLIEPIAKAFQAYQLHLKNLQQINDQNGDQTTSNYIRIINSAELEGAKAAVDVSFYGLKELRSSLVIHIGFQCLLNTLEKHRKALAQIRNVIHNLPDQLRNASMSK